MICKNQASADQVFPSKQSYTITIHKNYKKEFMDFHYSYSSSDSTDSSDDFSVTFSTPAVSTTSSFSASSAASV